MERGYKKYQDALFIAHLAFISFYFIFVFSISMSLFYLHVFLYLSSCIFQILSFSISKHRISAALYFPSKFIHFTVAAESVYHIKIALDFDSYV